MRIHTAIVCATVFVAQFSTSRLSPADPGPFDGKTFKGRIAYSADGNFNDPDDWAASPVALAILAECGLQKKLVHFDYNCILPKTDPEWEKEHEIGILGAAKRYGFRESVFHHCQKDLEGAIRSIAHAINASSADDPLYFILAGPMEVPARGIARSDPQKRKYVCCISHNCWNDGYASGNLVKHNKRDVIPLGITWVQIKDQNPRLISSPYGRPAKPDEWRPFAWMKDSDDARVRFLWERMLASTRPDCSDAGMAYFLVTGDEECDIAKLKKLLDDNVVPTPIDPRKTIRMEAENFHTFDACEVEYRNERAVSQRISVKFSGGAGWMETCFDEPYTAPSRRYDVEVRHSGAKGAGGEFRLCVNGRPQGDAWAASADSDWQSQTISGVEIRRGDAIAVELRGERGAGVRLDYVQLAAHRRP